jgi:alpha-beta hydrolase superfamily lysophospholipase
VNVKDIENWFNRLPTTDKTLRSFPNAAHSLDFDPHAPEYHEALADWILARVK